VFQDFANAAINTNNVAGAISWFQFGGDTYVVENAGVAGTLNFENGIDSIVKLTGAIDLSTATFLSAGSIPTIIIH
jgi:S-layer protein